MKKLILVSLLVLSLLFSSCGKGSVNPEFINRKLDKQQVERVTITNYRYYGRYTIIDKKGIDRMKNAILKAKDAPNTSGLTPDFIFDLYSGTQKLGTFKYIAAIDDSDVANLIDEKGKTYHMKNSIEAEFIKRIMKKDQNENVPEYYISLISLLIQKSNIPKGANVVIDISKDYAVTKSLLSVDIKRIIDSIDMGVNISFPEQVKKYDYLIKINTYNYSDANLETVSTVKKSSSIDSVKYEIEGTYNSGKWNYHIKYK